FRRPVEPADVVRTISAANLAPVRNSDPTLRDGWMNLDRRRHKAPLITTFGGDITTARLRAELAVSRLEPFCRVLPRWAANVPCRGGDLGWDDFETEVDKAGGRWKFLSEAEAQRLVGAYGSRLPEVLGDGRSRTDLGPAFGAQLTGAEVRYLMTREWARFPD